MSEKERIPTVITGRLGEDRACQYLESKEYKIIERNFRTRSGEIDIVASRKDVLSFIEVKTLPNGTPEVLSHELNQIKQQKIIKTAKLFLQKHREYSNSYISFDVIVIDAPFLDPVHHIVNAFSE